MMKKGVETRSKKIESSNQQRLAEERKAEYLFVPFSAISITTSAPLPPPPPSSETKQAENDFTIYPQDLINENDDESERLRQDVETYRSTLILGRAPMETIPDGRGSDSENESKSSAERSESKSPSWRERVSSRAELKTPSPSRDEGRK